MLRDTYLKMQGLLQIIVAMALLAEVSTVPFKARFWTIEATAALAQNKAAMQYLLPLVGVMLLTFGLLSSIVAGFESEKDKRKLCRALFVATAGTLALIIQVSEHIQPFQFALSAISLAASSALNLLFGVSKSSDDDPIPKEKKAERFSL